MNRVVLLGRLTKDVELRTTKDNVSCAKFTLAVNRRNEGSDFINCIAWRGGADAISKYVKKGQQLCVEGRIQTGSYEVDGSKRYTFDVVVDNFTFIGSKNNETQSATQDVGNDSVDWEDIPLDSKDLPF